MILTEYSELYCSCSRVANTIHSYALVHSGQMPGICLKPQNRPVVQKLHFFSLQIQQVSFAVSPVVSYVTYNISAFYDFHQEQVCITESSDVSYINNFAYQRSIMSLVFTVMRHNLLVQENNINCMCSESTKEAF